jgi:hypothetical protein
VDSLRCKYHVVVLRNKRPFYNQTGKKINITRLPRQVSLVEQQLLTLPEHPSSLQVVSGVCVTLSLVLYVCFVDRCLFFCHFSVGYYVVCPSLICGFWLPLWYHQTLLPTYDKKKNRNQKPPSTPPGIRGGGGGSTHVELGIIHIDWTSADCSNDMLIKFFVCI